MSVYFHPDTSDVALAEPNYERLDLRRRDIVDHAISVQERANTMCAIEFLKSQNIPFHIIERVLLEPARRRTPHH